MGPSAQIRRQLTRVRKTSPLSAMPSSRSGVLGAPLAQALAVREGEIVAVGSDGDVEAWRAADTRTIDLDGAFVIPGWNDNHVHFATAARFLEFNVMKVSTQAEFEERVREVLGRVPAGEWIVGGLWGAYDQWASGSAGGDPDSSSSAGGNEVGKEVGTQTVFTPDLRALDQLTATHPVFLRKFDDSEFAVNRAALEAAGLDPSAPRLSGATFVTERGRPTGIIRGLGVAEFFQKLIPPTSRERRLAQTRHALDVIRRAGVTNVSDMSDDLQLDLYRELHKAGDLTVRVHFRYPLERWRELEKRGLEIGSGDPWIRLGSLKGHIDGIMGNSTARFYQPYDSDPNNRGSWRHLMVDERGEFAEGRFLKYMLEADQANLQLSIHAIGDEANGLLLDYLEELRRVNGDRDRRFRLVHVQVVAEKDFPRLGENRVVAEVQPFHLSDDMRWMEERIGERVRGAYAFRRIASSGATLSFGSDWPGTAAAEYPIDPRLGLYAAVTRQTLGGEPEGGWFPEERLDIETALRAYTFGSAYGNFEDDIKGTLEVGKLADVTILDRNLLEIPARDILQAKVLYTITGGRIVYDARALTNP